MNLKNRSLYIADNLDVMRGMNSGIFDLIYLDPPFNSNRNYKAPIGSPAEGAEFKDVWTDADIKNEWKGEIADMHPDLWKVIQASETIHSKGMSIYLTAMSVRLFEMKRILKDTGSIYLHCDPTASHYLKIAMDTIFGKPNYKNQIVWNSAVGRKNNVKTRFGRGHDVILFYKMPKATFSVQYSEHDEEYLKKAYKHIDKNGKRYRESDLKAPGNNGHIYNFLGHTQNWRMPEKEAYKLLKENRIIHKSTTQGSRRNVAQYKRYADESKGRPALDNWTDIKPLGPKAKGRTGYPTQKPPKLLQRIIEASSNQGDWVFDPFCGCGTTMLMAESLRRNWVGCDISPDAEDIAKMVLEEHTGLTNAINQIKVFHKPPKRRDIRIPKPSDYKNELYAEQNGICNGCQKHFDLRNFSIDHIKPRVKGGTDEKDNLQLLCHACNSTKGTKSQTEFIKTLKSQGII